MKKAIRWIGIGITAAAAGTMLLADLALAAPPMPWQGVPQSFELDFDMFAPRDLTCEAAAPDAVTRTSRSISGVPHVTIRGVAQNANITCRLADGTTYTTDVPQRVDYRAGTPTRATVSYRAGADAMAIFVWHENSNRIGPRQVLTGAFRRVN